MRRLRIRSLQETAAFEAFGKAGIMRKVVIVLASAAVIVFHPSRGWAQCGVFSGGPSCTSATSLLTSAGIR